MLIAVGPNHPSSRHFRTTRQHGFLYGLGGGRYRLWDEDSDGPLRPSGDSPPLRRRARTRRARGAVDWSSGPAGVAEPDHGTRRRLVHALLDELHRYGYHGPLPEFDATVGPIRGWSARVGAYYWPVTAMDRRPIAEALDPFRRNG